MKVTQKLHNLFLFSLVVIVLATGSTAIGYIVAAGARDDDLPKSEKTEISVQVSNAEKQSSQMDATSTLVNFLDSTSFDSLLERSSALYDLFANVDLEMLQDYWEQAQNLEASNVRAEIQDVIIQRWSVLDPITALDVIEKDADDARKHVLFDFVFHEWSAIDLESAVDYVGSLEKDAQQRAIASIVRAREDLTYKQRREIARRLDCEWVAINVLRETTDSAVIDKPAQEWRSFIWENKDDLPNLSEAQNRMLGQLAYSWIVQEGVAAFEKMRHSLPSDFSLLQTTKSVSLELIDTNPQLAFDLVVAGKLREKETAYLQLAMDVVTKWAKTDPSKAFDQMVFFSNAHEIFHVGQLKTEFDKTNAEPKPYEWWDLEVEAHNGATRLWKGIHGESAEPPSVLNLGTTVNYWRKFAYDLDKASYEKYEEELAEPDTTEARKKVIKKEMEKLKAKLENPHNLPEANANGEWKPNDIDIDCEEE
ncbi:MAG: hypothetical protein F4227_03915 [Gammaproteobacteria bacterium]|nr:hypothetical protein [Gammaproteobacteria bacterium]MYF02129.1 hypothetical protein [Gammaproteobacteria bacterium]MYI76779.1 hypothetical protein [Gammaproteobacteria bacterium]